MMHTPPSDASDVDALFCSDQSLHRFYRLSPMIFYELTAEGRILSLNPAFEAVTGWPIRDWVGRPFIGLVVPEDRELALQEFAGAIQSKTRSFRRIRLIAADGGILTVDAWIEPCEGKEGICAIGYAQDVTHVAQLETQLERQANLLNSVSDAIIVTDLAFVIQEWNAAAEAIYGWQRSEAVGKSTISLLGTQYIDSTPDAVLKEFLQTGRWRGQVIQRHKNGAQLYIYASVNALFDEDGRRIGAVAINRNVTAEVNAQKALSNVERIYRQAIRIAGGVPYQRDYTGDGYSFLGEGFEELTGYRADEITGPLFTSRLRRIESYGENADLPHDERIRLARQGKGFVWREDYLFERKDGRLIWLADHAVPIFDEQGTIIGSLGILMDITERKEAEEERRRLQERMAQIERLETVGQLAGGVAHDFNNMLAVVLMRTEMALLQLDATSPIRHHLLEIYRAAQRAAELTRQLLGFARRQVIEPRPLDLNAAIEELLPMVRGMLGEAIELRWEPAPNLDLVYMDPAQVAQIVMNLCLNARDAITGIGQISITTGRAVLDEAYAALHADVRPGVYSVLTISDTGKGMTPEVLEHIFEPFFTTKEMGRGTGLGLATVYGIVQQNQGHIAVHSAPGVGTSIQIFLPFHQGTQSAPSDRFEPVQISADNKRWTILLVEDEPAVLKSVGETLRRLGHHILMAGTPSAALHIAEQHKEAIDLLLSDVVMPEMDGPTLVRQLRESYPALRVLFVSGYPAHLIAYRGLLPEDTHFLRKPFTIQELVNAIQQALFKPPLQADGSLD
ncbi:PAS domain S-box protein [Caldilinea sp.]|uniref:PAS domain-containing hybrid sensor histidine kinase/response regulator n=1 Tax=Caldilinea sp. TaxID=2293560 RepID=UPI001B1BC258|nr:PAS domain S-box protein [Caldilinea sp.]MBO9392498.1 PAS domain S-box protein [Caldilinea sp.]